MDTSSPQERFAELIRSDNRYHPEAYSFVFEALDYTVRMMHGEDGPESESVVNKHVTGPQLLEGVRRYSLETFGCLVLSVFQSWGITKSEDFGEIVFNLVESRLLNTQECDRKDDFRNGFNFREAFDKAWRPLPQSRA